MNTNDNFNSKKIIEEIENLENDATSKKEKRNFKLINFVEVSILVVLIIYLVMTVGSQLINDWLVDQFGYGYDYDYDEYESYNDYEDYYEDYSTTETDSSIMNTVSVEDFLNSNFGNMIATQSIYEDTSNTISTNTVVIEESVDVIEDTYDEEEILKQKFEDEKNNLNIVEEGKNINNKLLISIENKNKDFVYDLEVYTVFYKEDKIISVDSQNVEIILAKNKKYLKIDKTPKDYDRVEIFIDKDVNYEYTNELLHNNLRFESFIENEILEIELKNVGPKIDRASFTIIYFDKDKNILDIETTSDFDIGKYLGGSTRGYGVWDETNCEYVDYDDYQIILDYAGSYNY